MAHRIDTSTAQKDKFGVGKNGFTRGNPQTGVPATELDDDYFDMLQEEIVGIVEAAGDTLDKTRRNQLNAALGKLFQNKTGATSALGALVPAANRLPYFTGANGASLTDLTPVGRDILAAATKAAVLEYLGLGGGSILPVGVPVPWPSAMPPAGWLKCNGAAFMAAQYPQLALAYPDLILPDLRGEFIRGWDDGRRVDPDRGILTQQKGSLAIHDPSYDSFNLCSMISAINRPGTITEQIMSMNRDAGFDSVDAADYSNTKFVPFNIKVPPYALGESGFGYGATRPRNVAYNYIVRAV